MDLTIVKEKEMPLLSRKRVAYHAHYTGATPSNSSVQSEVAAKLKVNKENVEIRHIFTKYGESTAKVIAHVYEDPAVLNKILKLGKKQKEKIQKEAEKKEEEAKKEKESKEDKAEEETKDGE